MKIPKLPLALVVWEDANTGGDDAVSLDNVDAFHEPTIVHTLGWVLKQNEKGISLVTEFYDSTFRGRTFIPGKNVLDVIPYNLTKKKARHARSSAPPEPRLPDPDRQP